MNMKLIVAILLSIPYLVVTAKPTSDSIRLIETEKSINKIIVIQKEHDLFIKQLDNKYDSLRNDLENIEKQFAITTDSLKYRNNEAKNKISTIESSLSQSTILWVAGIFVILLLSLIGYFILRKKINSSDSDFMSEIETTRKKIEEESTALDQKLVDLLDKQLSLISIQNSEANKVEEIDHSLALKVADEIVRMEANLGFMQDDVKGKKQLVAAINRMKDNFVAKGYEIVDMLGKHYNYGMKVQATFIPDESLKEDESIITRIIKPQVNFYDEMIQSAEIQVNQGLSE